MYFTLTKEQVDIQKAAREFVEKEFRPVARDLDARETFDDRLWKKAADLGFLAVFVSENYGGLGLGYLEQCLIVEEFARVDWGVAHAIESTFFGAQLIQMVGTEEQKEKYLSALCAGKMRMGVAITEPDAGSDVASVTTAAVKVADEAIQVHGGYGILEEYDVAHYWRNAKVLEIFEGSIRRGTVLICN